jgi:hypothetical protein
MFFKRLTRWEFWPAWLANIPVYGMGLLLALRARDLLFFTNVNPSIPLSGAVGESKSDILDLLPERIKPATMRLEPGTTAEQAADMMAQYGIRYPVVLKPDVGERGFLVNRCATPEVLEGILERHPIRWVVQTWVDLPEEYSVFFYRFPDSGAFGIHSICRKAYLSITGDGTSTVAELLRRDLRGALQCRRLLEAHPAWLRLVPGVLEQMVLEPVGNHSRGTTFLDAGHLLDEHMIAAYDALTAGIPGVCLGRFDLKCASEEALRRGEILVVEMNGVFGEPAHVYDPAHSARDAYRILWIHWKLIYRLHLAQRRKGVPTARLRDAWQYYCSWRRTKKSLASPGLRPIFGL